MIILGFRSEDGQPPEMFDNPLYGSMSSSRGSKDHLPPPDAHFSFPKTDLDADRQHPVPTPRLRSFTCSETKPKSSSATNTTSSGLQPQNITKKPVVPSRSEGGMTGPNRPPVPMKSRPGQPQELQPKPRDYRDSSELPSKLRQQTRQGQPKDGMITTVYSPHSFFVENSRSGVSKLIGQLTASCKGCV